MEAASERNPKRRFGREEMARPCWPVYQAVAAAGGSEGAAFSIYRARAGGVYPQVLRFRAVPRLQNRRSCLG
jgi:hypothetical protein